MLALNFGFFFLPILFMMYLYMFGKASFTQVNAIAKLAVELSRLPSSTFGHNYLVRKRIALYNARALYIYARKFPARIHVSTSCRVSCALGLRAPLVSQDGRVLQWTIRSMLIVNAKAKLDRFMARVQPPQRILGADLWL